MECEDNVVVQEDPLLNNNDEQRGNSESTLSRSSSSTSNSKRHDFLFKVYLTVQYVNFLLGDSEKFINLEFFKILFSNSIIFRLQC